MVNIFVAKTIQEAELIIGMLRNNGIYAEIEGIAGSPAMDWYIGSSVYCQNIFVNECDEEKAMELVEAFFGK